MRAIIQRVSSGSVSVDSEIVGAIDHGLLVLVGVGEQDGAEDCRYLAEKTVGLRIFEDDAGKMNLSVQQVGGRILAVSQFTLWGDCRKGRRPSFVRAARPEFAEPLFDRYCAEVRSLGIEVQTGRFGAQMSVQLTNDGPVTIMLDSKRGF